MKKYDIAIIGGGISGLLSALVLSKLNKDVICIEKVKYDILCKDSRTLALSYSTCCLLYNIELWPDIKQYVTAIKQVNASEKNAFSQVHLDAKNENLPFLGVTVKLSNIVKVLLKKINNINNISLIENKYVKTVFAVNSNRYTMILEDNIEVNAHLLLACDGANSHVRTMLGIDFNQHLYNQDAWVFSVNLNESHNYVAYERFIHQGVLALLPSSDQTMSAVFVHNSDSRNIIYNYSYMQWEGRSF